MQANLSEIVKEALEIQCDGFIKLVEDATRLLSKENGKVGNLNIIGRLIHIKPQGEALIVGDLHGDLESLIQILKESNFLQKMNQNHDAFLIFLGDYGDRGEYSKEVYYTVLKLKMLFPEQVVLMRGNHEGPEDLLASPHDLPVEFQIKFGERWIETYNSIRKLFAWLYNAVLVEEHYLMIHGGLPIKAETIEDLAYAHATHPKQSFLEEMLWSDPNEMVKEFCASPRGAGKLFGEKITKEALRKFNVKVFIRGHEPCMEGYKINHKGKILTLFSRKGSPYFNTYGAYLKIDISQKFENAEQLASCIQKF
ncbi:MAG: metallophosphoesterase family protein [Candidatus Bathyarchaeia archaeon]|nr:metallophosphoesterase family protein [Candidatus Bathyarchaeia archaeon]